VVTAHDSEATGTIAARDLTPAAADLDGARALFRAYGQGLDALGHQVCARSFEEEVLGLPGEYAAPAGRLIVAEAGASPRDLVGVVALRRLTPSTCEMKRLYVRPAFRASGVGRQLAIAAIAAGRATGYERLVLDTLPTMTHAIALYRALGFRPIARYNDNDSPGVVFLERRLA
jgi:putative acetyltransferase